MTNVKKLTDGVYRVRATMPTVGVIGACTACLINEGAGALVDPGPGIIVPQVLAGMGEPGMKELALIIPTHVHLDHAGGCGELAGLFPKARVVVHPEGKRHLADPERLIKSTRQSYGDVFERHWGSIKPVPEAQLYCPADGETLSFGERPLQIIYSPGHAPHHMAVFDLRDAGLFCGEALGYRNKSAKLVALPSAAPPAFDPEAYLESIEKLGRVKPRTLLFAHSGIGRDPQTLIRSVAENTRALFRLMEDGLRDRLTIEDLELLMAEHISGVTGANKAELDVNVPVLGFVSYIRRKSAQA